MRRIDRHIGRTVLQAMLVVLLAFVGLNTIFELNDELGESGVGYGLPQALWFVLLTTPRRVYELIPYIALLGAVLGLGQLAGQGELTVLRAAGVSPLRLFGSASIPALAALLLAFGLGEYLAPWGEEAGAAHKAQARQASTTIQLGGGYWYREGGLFMHVAAMDTKGRLIGIRQYFVDGQQRLTLVRGAAEARYLSREQTWLMTDVDETRFDEVNTRSRHLDELYWSTGAGPELLGIRAVLLAPRKLSLASLRAQIAYLEREGLATAQYRLAFWGKVLQPFAILGLTLLALCFVIGPLRDVSMGNRLAIGTLVGLVFKYLQDLLGPMSMVYGVPASVGVAIPILVCWIVAGYGLRRVQ